jgi:hypothetical protein
MNRALRLGSVAGINVYVSWTSLLLIDWTLSSHLAQGRLSAIARLGTAFKVPIFAWVVLHELGRVFCLRFFGICIRNIMRLPSSSVALLERIPEGRMQKLATGLVDWIRNEIIAVRLPAVLAVQGMVREATGQFEARI